MSADVLTNRKAPRDYHIEETYEAGLVLCGTEVKSIRRGKANLSDAFARIEKGRPVLYGMDIQPYEQGNRFNHEPKTARKLLLHKQEIQKIFGKVSVKGRTLVALKVYWKSNKLKVLLGVGVGKNKGDKREDLKEKADRREMDRAMKSSRFKD
jgi:SsrA-binding protein